MNFELFLPESADNVLPYDGVVQDYGIILEAHQAESYLDYFLTDLNWQHDEAFLYGKHFKTDRKIAWYGDEDYQYHYSGVRKQAQPWNPRLLQLKQQIEQITNHSFNSCLANLYENGTQAMGWHSDDEKSLVSTDCETVIASLSLGAKRKFRFKHKHNAELVDVMLHTGQLIVMKGQTQLHWKHMLAKSTKIIEPRVNLTFRYFYPTTA